jgi:hypothetical protein
MVLRQGFVTSTDRLLASRCCLVTFVIILVATGELFSSRGRGLVCAPLDNADLREGAEAISPVQTVPYHKLIGALDPNKIEDKVWHDAALDFVEHNASLDALRSTVDH